MNQLFLLFNLGKLVLSANHQLISDLRQILNQQLLRTRSLNSTQLLVNTLSNLTNRILTVQLQISNLTVPV